MFETNHDATPETLDDGELETVRGGALLLPAVQQVREAARTGRRPDVTATIDADLGPATRLKTSGDIQ